MLYFLRFFEFHIKELSVQFTVNVLISVLSSTHSSPRGFGVLGLTKQLRSLPLQEASGSAFGYQCRISLNQVTGGLTPTSLDILTPVRNKQNTCCFPATTQAMGPPHSQAWWAQADSTCGYSGMCRPGVQTSGYQPGVSMDCISSGCKTSFYSKQVLVFLLGGGDWEHTDEGQVISMRNLCALPAPRQGDLLATLSKWM